MERGGDETIEVVAGSGGPAASDGRRLARWRRRRLVLAGAGLVVAAAGIATWQGLSSSHGQSGVLSGPAGGPAPRFSLPELAHPTSRLSLLAFRGRDLVVNFWASWCVPCRKEMPLLEATYRHEDGRVAIVGVATNDSPQAAAAFAAKLHVSYPLVSDQSAAVAERYGVYGLPTTVFVSPSGTVLGRHVGELHATTLQTALRAAFGSGSSP